MSQARVGRLPEVPPEWSKQPTSAGPKSVSFETTVTATGNNTGATEPTIFLPGEAVPSGVAATLWRGTAGLDMDQAQQAMDQLGRLRLVTVTGSGITLDDAVRDALREGLGETELARVHGLLLDTVAEDPPQPESPGTPADTGFVITAAAVSVDPSCHAAFCAVLRDAAGYGSVLRMSLCGHSSLSIRESMRSELLTQ
jgi:hypothetical protein